MKISEKNNKFGKAILSNTAYGCICMTGITFCIILIIQIIFLLDGRRELLQSVNIESVEKEEAAGIAIEFETNAEGIMEADTWEMQLRPGRKEYEWQKSFGEIPEVLDIPIKTQEELFIYSFINYGLEQYVTENLSQVDLAFYCDLNEDWLHWKTVGSNWDLLYQCEIPEEIPHDVSNNRYAVRLQNPEQTVYMLINTYDAMIFIYRQPSVALSELGEFDLFEIAKQKEDDRGMPIHEDIYVIPDWYRPEEQYFDVPWYPYLDGYVEYAIDCYCEDNGIEEEFRFDMEEDMIAVVTTQLYTVRVRSPERTIYIDIDREYGHFQIYEIE